MNAVGKSFSIVLYVIALVITAIVAKNAFVAVAIAGMAAFFVVHITLRVMQRREVH